MRLKFEKEVMPSSAKKRQFRSSGAVVLVNRSAQKKGRGLRKVIYVYLREQEGVASSRS